jgi:hypothetical protein
VEVPFLFSVDPTQYPDVNPLLGARGTLTVEQPEVEASESPSPRVSPSETGGPVAAGNKSGSGLWLVVGLVGVIVATVVVVVVVLVVSSRSKRKGYEHG